MWVGGGKKLEGSAGEVMVRSEGGLVEMTRHLRRHVVISSGVCQPASSKIYVTAILRF